MSPPSDRGRLHLQIKNASRMSRVGDLARIAQTVSAGQPRSSRKSKRPEEFDQRNCDDPRQPIERHP